MHLLHKLDYLAVLSHRNVQEAAVAGKIASRSEERFVPDAVFDVLIEENEKGVRGPL